MRDNDERDVSGRIWKRVAVVVVVVVAMAIDERQCVLTILAAFSNIHQYNPFRRNALQLPRLAICCLFVCYFQIAPINSLVNCINTGLSDAPVTMQATKSTTARI